MFHFICISNFIKSLSLVDILTRPSDFDVKPNNETNIQIKRNTSEEAFNTTGMVIDNENIEEFIGENTPESGVQVEKFEYLQGEESLDSAKLVDSPLEVTTTVTQQSCITKLKTSSSSECVDIPKARTNRRLSTISIEEANKISTTPEGEKYFMKREESFVAKVAKGEVETLAVEISEFFPLEPSTSAAILSVRPLDVRPDKEIVVSDVGSQSSLTVKPVENVARSIPCCSYEHLYDKVKIEEIREASLEQMSSDELLQNLGDNFVGTNEIPEFFTSYEELYQRPEEEENTASSVTSSIIPGSARWSAPIDSPIFIPPPDLSSRFQHTSTVHMDWNESNILMSSEAITGGDKCDEF